MYINPDMISVGSFSAGKINFTKSIVPKRIYRAAEKSEILKLINGEKISGYNYDIYTTSNPKGWGAKNWYSSFKSYIGEKTYFITYKKNFTSNAKPDPKTNSYIIKEYSLADVDTIRLGQNLHGKIIWAQDEKSVQKDLEHKRKDIQRLLQIYQNAVNDAKLNKIVCALKSYVQEFPIICRKILNSRNGLENKDFAPYIFDIMSVCKDEKNMEIARQYCKKFLQNPQGELNNKILLFFLKRGQKQDIKLLQELKSKTAQNSSQWVYDFLIKSIKENTFPHRNNS